MNFQLVIFLGLCSMIFAHFRLVNPVPRSSDPGIKSYPCGPDAFFGAGQAVTTLKPGVMTLTWEETISHTGAPFQIAISVGNDNNYDKIVLVDHIPHNDQDKKTFKLIP
jgi:hypothetical protein